jgi:hypothetical protein
MINLRKTLVAVIAIATIAGTVAATSTEASAHGFPHWGWGVGAGAAVLGTGLAIAATSPIYDGCYMSRRAIVDPYGNLIGYQPVRVCE